MAIYKHVQPNVRASLHELLLDFPCPQSLMAKYPKPYASLRARC